MLKAPPPAPVPERPSAVPVDTERGWTGMPWYRSWWVRCPVILLLLADAGWLRGTASQGYDDGVLERMAPGAIAVAVVGAVVAGIAYAIARARGRKTSYFRVLTSFPLVLSMWAVMFLEFATWRASNPDGTPVGKNAPENDKTAEQRRQFVAWWEVLIVGVGERGKALTAYNRWSDRKDAFGAQASSDLRRSLTAARAYQSRMDTLPQTAGLAGPTADLQAAATQLVRCISETRKVLTEAPVVVDVSPQLNRAGRRCDRSEVVAARAAKAGDARYAELGGADAFPQIAASALKAAETAQSQ